MHIQSVRQGHPLPVDSHVGSGCLGHFTCVLPYFQGDSPGKPEHENAVMTPGLSFLRNHPASDVDPSYWIGSDRLACRDTGTTRTAATEG